MHGPQCGDDAARHRALKAERVADGVDALADHQVGRVSERYGLKVRRVVNLQQCEVVCLVFVQHRRAVILLVGERDLNGLRAFDHMVVRQDVSLLVDDEARTLALLRDWLVEEVVGNLHRGDVHHRWQSALVDRNILLLF